jgi:hypothetical protein
MPQELPAPAAKRERYRYRVAADTPTVASSDFASADMHRILREWHGVPKRAVLLSRVHEGACARNIPML